MDKLYEDLKSKWKQFELFEAAKAVTPDQANKKLIQGLKRKNIKLIKDALIAGADPNIGFNNEFLFNTVYKRPDIGNMIIKLGGKRINEVDESIIDEYLSSMLGKDESRGLIKYFIEKRLINVDKQMLSAIFERLYMLTNDMYFMKIFTNNLDKYKINEEFIEDVINVLENTNAHKGKTFEEFFTNLIKNIKRVDIKKLNDYIFGILQWGNVYSQRFINRILELIENPKISLSKNTTNFNFIEDSKNQTILNALKKNSQFKKWYLHPRQEAINYNKEYGIFLHSFKDLSSIKYLHTEHQDIEICVSTLDSRTVFNNNIILIGSGNIRLLFDFDCYSVIDESNGKRYATTAGINYDELKVSDLKLKKSTRVKKTMGIEKIGDEYYDEGFIKPKDTTWLIISGNTVDLYYNKKAKGLISVLDKYNLKYMPSDIFNTVIKNGKLNLLGEYLDPKQRRLVASENEDEFDQIQSEIDQFVKLLKTNISIDK